MLKKIVLGVALVAGLASVSVASIMLDAHEDGAVIATSIDTLSLMSQSRDLPDNTPANPI